MPHEDRVRLDHILETAKVLADFVAGRTRADLEVNHMLGFAIARAIEIIGEAASKMSAETRALSPNLPWPDIIGMRNRLVHAYFDVDRDILWSAATHDVPQLVNELRTLSDGTR
jgi:uncharacterized protein with HEPN domain